ncbi:sugar phosphate nucleotidyltransferase [Actinokineospora cianjurensis]|uniref:Nucleotidyltransferase-like protein n=1 Tax=Actinokineospora cianjurensis TaxID=585224 RepID=A0A421AVE3_9PSEU|nr:sugar phosphate nucleotidyltransferase [Actinokineospora cianjurensis]RLK53988.1 nucleotidyltransferase-like protein [Actinokineospora cianjurensis]
MKALVLAGGSGTRLRPFSYSMPKQLVPIANTPVLGHVLRGVRELEVGEVGVGGEVLGLVAKPRQPTSDLAVVVEAGARVPRSRVEGPAIIGTGASRAA